MNPYKIIMKPYITEKAMLMMEKENKLVFIINPKSTKRDVSEAIQSMYEVKVDSVNISKDKHGKKAIVKLSKDYSAEDIGMRLGLF